MNQAVSRGPIAAFFVGLWNVINFTRKLVLNFLFFGLLFLFLVIFVAAVGRGNGVKPLLERTTLVIAPEGRLVEQFSADPATRALAKAFGDKNAEEVQLRDLVRAIDAARE
ncbi:MAG: signal peptide peptidase SppA, partial [Lysobacteraceae bacterium]